MGRIPEGRAGMASITWSAFPSSSYTQLDFKRMNKLLADLDSLSYSFIWTREPYRGERLTNKAFMEETDVIFRVGYEWAGKRHVAWCWLDDGRQNEAAVPGKDAYAVMSRYYKAPQMPDEICAKFNADGTENLHYLTSAPLLYSNPAFQGKETDAICYDLNGAYGWALEQPIPDTTKIERDRDLKEGELGFLIEAEETTLGWGRCLKLTFKGFASFAFKAMPSPYLKFVDRWHRERANSSDPKTKSKAKAVINESIGYLQLKNPFIRACVVERTTKRIESLMDEDTVYCNTDCVCSAKPRPDIPVSPNLGDFKIEHEGKVRLLGYNYQWGESIPTYRGIPKSAFRRFEEREGRKFDILKDEAPDRDSGKLITFDTITRRLIKC